jgi:hypothetical protein
VRTYLKELKKYKRKLQALEKKLKEFYEEVLRAGVPS